MHYLFVSSLAALSPLYASPIHKPALPLSAGCTPVPLPPQLPALLPVGFFHFLKFILELCTDVIEIDLSMPQRLLLKCVYLVSNHLQLHASCAPECGTHYQSRAWCGRRRSGELWGSINSIQPRIMSSLDTHKDILFMKINTWLLLLTRTRMCY